MKWLRLFISIGLGVILLAGVVLALTWSQQTTARAAGSTPPVKVKLKGKSASPVAPLILPLPYLSDDDVADAPYDNPPAPTVDGLISPGEYAGADKVTFPGYEGNVEVFFKEDGANLYVAFELPDRVNHIPVPHVSIFVDTLDDGGGAPQADDFWFIVYRNGGVGEWQGNGTGWSPGMPPFVWTSGVTETMSGWSVEFSIPFLKLNITAGSFKSLGLALENGGLASGDHFWPDGAAPTQPDTWGSLVSSSDWGTFYWKPGPWEDYAPSGLPDFDQMQVGPTYCGPFAAANSLWWFDSRFEEHPAGPTGLPPTLPISDSYTLVQPYGNWDDHDPQNVISLTLTLGKYFNTDVLQPGTNIYDMYTGIQRYLRDQNLWDDYIVTLVNQPEFSWIADEAMRGEDVVLLLGFYEEIGPGMWNRIGGHYVTVAGVDTNGMRLAISDPAQDNAELTGAGRVLSGTLIPHQPVTHTGVYTLHNDAGNVSHDIYVVLPSSSPGGIWALAGYQPPTEFLIMPGLNPNPKWTEPPLPWQGGPIHAEIEYALAVSPYDWKASGRWLEDETVPLHGRRFDPYDDFAPSGMPDFDQKQDAWIGGMIPPPRWSHCGPVAAANSLWWFDSKFEYDGATPPAISDTYPLVRAYGHWDDHDPRNVGNNAVGIGLVEELAMLADTNGMRTGALHSGTLITDLYDAIITYTQIHRLRQGYVITKVNKPEFWWVAEEVERSEDVVLLLGFYAQFGPGLYERVGGHYVTLPGVDKQGGYVAFSDPYWDRMEEKLPPNEFQRQPLWSGRIGSDGDSPLGPTGLLPTYTHVITHNGVYTLHNDAANVSHDVYRVRSTDSPGGIWGPEGYVDVTDEITNFGGMNGPGMYPVPSGVPVQTEVEWALAVSPVADVWVEKSVTPAAVAPGEWVTFTIRFGNVGNLAENVVITDLIPTGLINASVVGTWNNYGGAIVAYDTFTWTVDDVPFYNGVAPQGIITLTAQVDPNSEWVDGAVVTNTVAIATTTQEQYQLPARPNTATVTFTVQMADVSVVKTTPLIWLSAPRPGDWVTFTLDYTNDGSATAHQVVITDLLPTPPLTTTGAWYTYTNNYGGVLTGTPGLTFAWSAGDLPSLGSGVITLTAQIDPRLTRGGSFTNTAEIATSTADSDPSNNRSAFTFQVCMPPAGAHFTYTPAIPVVNRPVTFTGSVTRGEPVDYSWSFGDVTPGSGNPVTHTYTTAGFYTVWMTATSTMPLCGQDVYSETISVCEPASSAHIAYAPSDPRVGQTVYFTATVAGSGPFTYTWAADDGWQASGVTATHAFATRGLHTVWLTATNRCSQVYTNVAVFVREYGVDVQPDSGGTVENPGKTVVYTLTLYNTGNMTDMYTIAGAVSGQPWTTTWPMLSVGPVAGGDEEQFTVSVEIPPGAADGEWSRVAITATSLSDGSKRDTSVLTTTAYSGTITRGVAVAPHAAARAGRSGTTVTYTLRVTNTGTVADIIDLSYTNAGTWTVSFSADPLGLNAGAGQDVEVYVGIPSGILGDAVRVITVTATSQGDPTQKDSAILTTSVLGRFIYLPLVMRNF